MRVGETVRVYLHFSAHDFAVPNEAGDLTVVPGRWTIEVGSAVTPVVIA